MQTFLKFPEVEKGMCRIYIIQYMTIFEKLITLYCNHVLNMRRNMV